MAPHPPPSKNTVLPAVAPEMQRRLLQLLLLVARSAGAPLTSSSASDRLASSEIYRKEEKDIKVAISLLCCPTSLFYSKLAQDPEERTRCTVPAARWCFLHSAGDLLSFL